LTVLFEKLYLKPVLKVAVKICSCLINEILAEKMVSISSQVKFPE